MANEIPTPAEPVSPVNPSAIPSDLNASPDDILKAARSDSFRASQGLTPWSDGVPQPSAPPKPAAAPAQAAPANGMPTAFKPYTPAQDVNRPAPDPVMDSVDVPSSRSNDPDPPGAVPIPQAKDGYFKVLGYDLAQDAMGVGNAFMRGSAVVARTGARLVGFPLAKAADATTSKAMGKTNTGAQDALGDFIKAHIDPAIDEYWKGPDLTGNPAGQVASGLAEFLPQLVTGAAAPITSAASAATEKGFKAIDEGHSVKTAAALATIAGIQQYLFMHIPLKDPSIAKRILKAAGLGVGVDIAGKEVEKHLADVLKDPDYQAAVKDIDPLNPTDAGTNALVQTVLAILHGKGALKPKSQNVPGPGGVPPAGPTTFAGGGKTNEGNAVTPVDVSKPVPPAPAPTAAQAEPPFIIGPDGKQIPNPNAGQVKSTAPPAPASGGMRQRFGTPGESLEPTIPTEMKPGAAVITPTPAAPTAPAANPKGWEINTNANPASVAASDALAAQQRAPAPATPAAPIGDQPSAESSKDLQAQFMDAMNPKTPRQGVLVSKGSMAALKDDATGEGTAVREIIKKAQNQGRLVKTPNGDILVMPTAASALKAKTELASGSDPQAVIGRITGAGNGKRADQTVVVQGQTPAGAVAKESLVAPAEAPAKVEQVIAEGKRPVVTTPEAAQQRRAETVAAAQTPVETAAPAAPEAPKGEALKKKKLTQMTAEEMRALHMADEPKPQPVKAIAEVGKKEVPVHLEEGAPEGMQRVRPLNDEGEPGQQTHDIPKERVRTGEATKPAAAAPVKAPAEEASKTAPPVESGQPQTPLEQALAHHEALETPTPGRKRIGKLSDRQSNSGDFANVLLTAANEAHGKVDDAIVNRAVKAANEGKNLGGKSTHATEKGQGTGNARVTAVNDEMHRAARLLLGKGRPGDELPAVEPKRAALTARTEKAKAKVAEAKTVGYHGTKKPGGTIKAGDIGVHVGSRETAEKVAGAEGTVHAVDVTGKTVRAEEPPEGAWHNPMAVIRVLRTAGVEIPEDLALRARNWEKNTSNVQRGDQITGDQGKLLAEIRAHLKKQGISNIVYDNKFEGGGDSHIVLSSDVTPKETAKPKSAAKRAEAEVREKFPGVENLDENVLAKRMLKKRTAELEAEEAKAAAKTKSEMVEAPVFKEVEKTVTDEQLRKARNTAKVDADQARTMNHPSATAKAEKSQAEYDALKRQHDIEHGVALEPDEPKTAAEQRKVADAAKDHAKLVEDYTNASDEEAPAIFDQVVASAEKLGGRKMTEQEIADAKRVMDNQREIAKLTQEQESDKTIDLDDENRGYADTATLLKSRNPLTRALAQLHDNLRKSGILRKLEDVRASGATIGTHEVLRDMIANAPNAMLRGMLQRLLLHVPDLPVRPTMSVHDPRSGETNHEWGGLFDRTHNYIQYRIRSDRPFSTESLIHEVAHAATAYELAKNPHGELATELESLLHDVTRRVGDVYGHDVVAEHLRYFRDGKVKPANPIRDLYGLYNIREFVAEAFANPGFQRMLAMLDRTGDSSRAPTTFMGRMISAVGKFLGLTHETPLLNHVMDLTQRIMEKQSSSRDFRGVYDPPGLDGTLPSEVHAENLPYSAKERILADAMAAAMDERDVALMANIGPMVAEPPHLPKGDADLSRIMDDDSMKAIRGFAAVTRSGAMAALRHAKAGLTAADQLLRRNRADFGHPDDPKNPLVQFEEATDGRHSIRHEMTDKAAPIAEARLRLPKDVDKKLGQLQIDSTMWGIDPSKPKDAQQTVVIHQRGFDKRYDEFAKRWANTPDAAKAVFVAERDYLKWAARKAHRAGVDVALSAYDMRDITPAQRSLLYSVKDPSEFDELIGAGKLINIGDSNDPVKRALKSLAGMTQMQGFYAPLARHGDFVAQLKPEGTKAFATQAEAEAFAAKVKSLSPGSHGKVRQLGGKWSVDYKTEYTSFHKTAQEAEADAQRMRDAGFDIGHVTQKIYGEDNVPMTSGMKELVAEASRQIHKGGENSGTQALVENLKGAFLRMMANRSAYSASRLARKNVAGVKAEEMGRNFAQHVQSTAFHTSAMMTVFKEAEALGAVRAAARDQHAAVDQKTMYRRGRLVEEIGKRMAQEARQYGSKVTGNAFMAKLGYSNYLFSFAHTAINLTQNFTTAMPLAGVRFGPGKATLAFARAMKTVVGPAFKTTFFAHIKPGSITGRDVLNAVLEAIRKDPVHGKWARGENSPLQQLIDKGVITSTFSNELADIAKGDNPFWGRIFEYARLLPHLSDVFNRTTTALAHLELSGGNVRHTADFVNETHINYSSENMPRAFRAVKQVPVFGTSVVMFKTYMQGMTHLMYSMVRDSVMGGHHAEGNFLQKRANAMKTVGALVLGTALFTGLKGATPELVHLGAYAYNKLFGDKNKYWSFEESMHHVLSNLLGEKGGELAFAGLPHAAGIDVANRMGFNELMLHNPPDLLTADSDTFNKFVVDQLGTVPGLATTNLLNAYKKISNGDIAGGISEAVPIKAWQTVASAFAEYRSGNTHEDGNMMIEPGNAYGAAMQAFGFKPSALANAQEKQGNAIEYRNFVDSRKKAIVHDIVTNGLNDDTRAKRDAWNKDRTDPRDRITASDVFKAKHQKHMAEAQVEGRVHERNRDIRKLNDYTGD